MSAPSSLDLSLETVSLSDSIRSSATSLEPSTPYDALRSFLNRHSDAAILRHALGVESIPNAPPLMDHIIVNAIDCESHEYDHDKLTEIGLAAFESNELRKLRVGGKQNIGPYAENLLKQIYFYHYRLKPNVHLLNKRFCPGDPTKNRFGQTRFLSVQDAQSALKDAFQWPMDPEKPELGYCPVVFLGHSLGNDTQMLADSLNFSASVFGTVVRFIDTQNLAKSTGVYTGRNQVGLRTLCNYHNFGFRDSHTAGNDTAYTMINAVFMALADELFHRNVANPDSLPTTLDAGSGKSAQDVVDTIEKWSQQQNDCSYGSAVFCGRCESTRHFMEQCRARVLCTKCAKAGRTMARNHMTQRFSWKDRSLDPSSHL